VDDFDSPTADRLVPVLPLKDVSLFPGASLAVVVSKPHAIAAVRMAERFEVMLLALAQRDPGATDPGSQGLHQIGTLGTIREALAVSPLELRLKVDGFRPGPHPRARGSEAHGGRGRRRARGRR